MACASGTAARCRQPSRRADAHVARLRGHSRTRCGLPANSGSAAHTPRGCSRSTISRRRCGWSTTFEPPSLTLAQRAGSRWRSIRACGLVGPAAGAGHRVRLRGQRHTIAPRPARRPLPLRRRQRLLRAVPRPLDDLQLRVLRRRRADARGGPGGQARAGLQEARAPRRRARARRRLRLGQLRDPRRQPPRRPRGRDHAVRAARPSWLANGLARPAWPTESRSAWPTTARCPTGRSTRSRASGWSSTWGRSRSTCTRRRLHGLLEPGGRLLNHGIAKLKDFDTPDEGAFSERFVFPDGVPLPLSRILHALERAEFTTTHVEGLQRDYAKTIGYWIDSFDANWDEAVRLARDRARAGVASLSTRREAGLRDRLGVGLPGARAPLICPAGCAGPCRRARSERPPHFTPASAVGVWSRLPSKPGRERHE